MVQGAPSCCPGISFLLPCFSALGTWCLLVEWERMRVSGTDDALSPLWVTVPCTSRIWATPGAVCGLEICQVKHQHLLWLSAGSSSRGAHSALLKKSLNTPPVPKPHHIRDGRCHSDSSMWTSSGPWGSARPPHGGHSGQ